MPDEKKEILTSIRTRRGELRLPVFLPDATRASVRSLTSDDITQTGTRAMVVNTYHLLRHASRIEQLGGIHRFMRWDGAVFSDSGGYQVYSLIHRHGGKGNITEDGVEFRDERSGERRALSPEEAIRIQFALGSDMMAVLDDPRPNDAPKEEIERAVDRSVRWAVRCKEEFDRQIVARGMNDDNRPLLFGVVQGGKSRELRKRCVDGLVPIGFDGYGFGARHIDEYGEFLGDIVAYTASLLPEDKPRFALGAGTPWDITRCFQSGWQIFDCVIPTREGRHGRIFVFREVEVSHTNGDWYETLTITNEAFRDDERVLEVGCDCAACSGGYSRAYIRHLFHENEPLGPRLASTHNLHFYQRLMEKLTLC
jgi:queuine tRNA-ribosyltransferase